MRFTQQVSPALVFASVAFAQEAGGVLNGRITDIGRRPLANAVVTARETVTGSEAVAKSKADGSYRMTDLAAGPYTLTVLLSGYNVVEQFGVVVRREGATTQDVVLPLNRSSSRPTGRRTSK